MVLAIWLTKKAGERFQFPVNPESFEISSDMKHHVKEIANLGEVIVAGNRSLREISFGSFFPRDYEPSYCNYSKLKAPYETAKMLEGWMHTKQVLNLNITGTNVTFDVLIASFKYEEKAGEVGDVYFEISFKEYRAPVIRKYDPTAKEPTRPGASTAGSYYTVKSGDTLSGISKKFYNVTSKWNVIYEANKKIIGSNPSKIYVGQRLYIPGVNEKITPSKPTPSTYQKYTIRSGDTLIEVANAYGITLSTLQSINPGVKATNLQVGQVINLPGGAVKKYDPRRLTYSSPAPRRTYSTTTSGGTKSSIGTTTNTSNKTNTSTSKSNPLQKYIPYMPSLQKPKTNPYYSLSPLDRINKLKQGLF